MKTFAALGSHCSLCLFQWNNPVFHSLSAIPCVGPAGGHSRFPIDFLCQKVILWFWLVSCIVSVFSVVFCCGGYEQTHVWIKCGRTACNDIGISCNDMDISTRLLQLPLKYSAQYTYICYICNPKGWAPSSNLLTQNMVQDLIKNGCSDCRCCCHLLFWAAKELHRWDPGINFTFCQQGTEMWYLFTWSLLFAALIHKWILPQWLQSLRDRKGCRIWHQPLWGSVTQRTWSERSFLPQVLSCVVCIFPFSKKAVLLKLKPNQVKLFMQAFRGTFKMFIWHQYSLGASCLQSILRLLKVKA